jgi:hypothetical protein
MNQAEREAYQSSIGANPDGLWGPETAGKSTGQPTGSYNLGELIEAAAGGMSKAQMEEVLQNRGVNTNKATVQADIKKALSK